MKSKNIFILTFFIFSILYSSECTSTYSIDLGSEFMKIAVVVPGIPMEVALNGESQRKTPTVVFIKDGERLFGEPAMNMGIKYPKYLYHSITTLLGKTIDDSFVKEFISNFPYYDMYMDANNQLAFKDGKLSYSVEELLAMILGHANGIAETYSELPMKSGIIVVPPFYTQDERKAVLRSADIAGINVLRLMHTNTAVGLNYGIFRRKTFNFTVQYYMFYDVGSSATVASIIGYRTLKDTYEEVPQLAIVGVGYDRTLGASLFTLRIQQYLAKAFNSAKKTKSDVTKVPRSMAKLYKEAARVVKVLSANNEVYAQIENVLDDKDFKLRITRLEFEDLCEDLFVRFVEPLHKALESAQIPMTAIKEIILMGGGTRIPKIQDILLKISDRSELGKGINTDEASALGAVYQAAFISPGFKVQKFLIKDKNLFPISIDFNKNKNNSLLSPYSILIFNYMDTFPKKSGFTFNTFTKDFDFNVSSGTMDIDKKILFHVSVTNFTDIYNKYMAQSDKFTTEFKGAKANFLMDNSGKIYLTNIKSLFERKWINDHSEDDESTLKKLGETISNLFGSETVTDDKKENDTQKETENNNNETDAISKEAITMEIKSEKNESKPIIIEENVNFIKTWKSFIVPTNGVKQESRQMILRLKAIDDDKMALDKAKNELESYIFSVKNKLIDDNLYISCSSESERNAVKDESERASEWYENQDMNTGKEDYSVKYKSLVKLMINIDTRVKELQSRPAVIKKLSTMLNTSRTFLDTVVKVSGEDKIITKTEFDSLSKLINETTKWFDETNNVFTSMKLYEDPLITVADLESHVHNLQREMGYLINKIDLWKRQTPPPASKTSEKDDNAKNKTETPDITSDSKSDIPQNMDSPHTDNKKTTRTQETSTENSTNDSRADL